MKEKNLYLKILSYLSEKDAIREYICISNLFNKYYNKPDQQYHSVYKKNPRNRKIVKYLEAIKEDGFIEYIDNSPYASIDETETEWKTKIKFKASITVKGIEFYNGHLLRRKTINNMNWTRFLSVVAIIISLLSIFFNVYIHKIDEIKKLNTIELPKD